MWNRIVQFLCFLYVGSIFSGAEEDLRATIKSLIVTSDIKFRYAATRVSAEYTNPYNSPARADFHVTLPAQAYISNFSMTVDENVTYGVVKRKEEAKEIYEKAIARGESTGYVEVKHRFTNVYDISVNVEPGKHIVFNLTYQELLQRKLGKYQHVIHLINKEVINNFLIEVFISEPQNIIGVEIPQIRSDELESVNEETKGLEAVTIEYTDEKNVYIRYNPSPEEQKEFGNDGIEGLFKVNYDVDREDNPNMVYAVDGYFVHFFDPDSFQSLPKNIVFMLDVSGSMRLKKLQQLKEAMTTILNSLKPDLDTFLIGYFSKDVQWMNDGDFMPALKNNTADAISQIKQLFTSGGTDINMALLESIKKLNSLESSTRKNVLFFLTDGQPTMGVIDTESIRNNIKKANNDSISFFMLGFGDGANINFLKKVATENGGFGRKIYVAADSQLQIEGLYNEISNILLKDIQITYLDSEIDSETLSSTNFSSFFKGSEIVTTGKLDLDHQKEMNVQISMMTVDGSKTVNLKLELPNLEEQPNNPNLISLNSLSEITRNTWVYLTLKQLLKEEKSEENTEKIISLALRYGFVTPLTSMVVTKANLVGRVQNEDVIKGGPLPKYFWRAPPGSYYSGPPGSPGSSHGRKVFLRKSAGMRATTTPKVSSLGVTQGINFIPAIFLKPYGCNETLCLGRHQYCLPYPRVLLLADNRAYIYIFAYLMKTSPSNCMEALTRLVIKKKRKVLAQITPDMMTKNQKTFDLTNKSEVVLTVKKHLRLKVYFKTVDNQKAFTVHFTILQPLPHPKGILGKYMTNVTCQRKGPTELVLENNPESYKKITYDSTNPDKESQCFMNIQ